MSKSKETLPQLAGALSRLRGLIQRNPAPVKKSMAKRRRMEQDIDSLTKRIILPSLPVSDEEMARATHQDKGQKLARQDRWGELSKKIRYADETRLATPGGETASLLLAYGARSDIVASIEDALHDGQEPDREGVDALEEVLEEEPGDYACSLVVALAHVDIAWAWHSIASEASAEMSRARARYHIERAEAIMAPFDGVKLDAPSVLAARCALNANCPRKSRALADDYGNLIELDPHGYRHMRSLGRHMLPQISQTPNALELEARRTALRAQEYWGAGGYTWVYFDALALEPQAMPMLDPDFFIDGLRDIISRKRDQHVINLLASFCAIIMAPQSEETPAIAGTQKTRNRIHDCLDWILKDHLQELHPLIWSQTLLAPGQVPMLPSRRALVAKGRQTALRIIASRFASEIADGSSIAFSRAGMYRLPSL